MREAYERWWLALQLFAVVLVVGFALIPTIAVVQAFNQPAGKLYSRVVRVTIYTSTTAECDADPFTNARGLRCKDGDIACNFLPFGTRVWVEGWGKKTFTVNDRMAKRLTNNVDIWLPKRPDNAFGCKRLKISYWGAR